MSESLEQELTARGLLGRNLAPGAETIVPPAGTEVDETVQTSKRGHQTISRTRAWTERMARGNALHIELTSFPSQQMEVSFWVLPANGQGCELFGRSMYDATGRLLKSEFWRNDRELRITGAADFPPDLYPNAVPAVALPRALGSMQQGASGRINQQITPYGFVDLQVTVRDNQQVQVPAGRFDAVKVSSQPNVATILPSWPRFMLGVVNPFLPQTTYYFESSPPYRMLRKEQEGTPLIGGPEATTDLVRYYIAGVSETASAQSGG